MKTLVAIVALGLSAAPSAAVQTQAVTALIHGRVIDGDGGAPIEDGVVVIRGDRIEAVGRFGEVVIPANARTIDVRRRSVMPGLVDLHTHLAGGWDGNTVDLLGYRHFLRAFLYAGVTTVFDLANVLPFTVQLRQEVAAGRLTGPRIYTVGALIDGATPAWPPISFALSSDDQVAGIMKQLKAVGVDAVKAYGGLSDAQVTAVVEAARRDSLWVIADLWRRNGSLAGAQTGIRAFAHAGRVPMTEEAIRYMKANGVASLTTLVVMETGTKRRFTDRRMYDEPLVKGAMPPWYLEQLEAYGAKQAIRSDSQQVAGLKAAMQNVKPMFDAGVLLAAGTDAPYPGDYFGEGLHRELELLVEAGLTPLQAITLATKNAAQVMRKEREWGRLAPRLTADILVVEGDPTITISDTRKVAMVFQGGRLLDRAALRFDPKTDPGHRPAAPLQVR